MSAPDTGAIQAAIYALLVSHVPLAGVAVVDANERQEPARPSIAIRMGEVDHERFTQGRIVSSEVSFTLEVRHDTNTQLRALVKAAEDRLDGAGIWPESGRPMQLEVYGHGAVNRSEEHGFSWALVSAGGFQQSA